MRVAVMHGEVPPGAPADEQDVLVEVGAVMDALSGLGHEVYALPVSLDLGSLSDVLSKDRPELAFNLVESLGGRGSLIHLAPAVLDALGIQYTGSPAEAVFATSSKIVSKRMLHLAGIPTPRWVEEGGAGFVPGAQYIIKSVWEHASIGLEADSVATYNDPEGLMCAMEQRRGPLGGTCFAEEFIDGREFNISLIELDGKPSVLPHAEIRFMGFPEGARRMVGYRAKWDEDSAEYKNTVRSFEFTAEDSELLEELSRITIACWELFGLRGYARVDFRVDEACRPWVLEVNINPCISPDGGFMAASSMAGLGYDSVVSAILDAAMARAGRRGILR
jgi:D-alanine-D-alanine ligase